MRRIIGQTGAPQVVPPISTTLAPLVDFTSEESQRLLDSRTIYLNLWAYFAFDNDALSNYDGDPYPAFWQAMTGEAPANALQSCLFASDTNDIQAAVASSKHRIVNDLVAIPHQTQDLNMPLDSILDAIGPTQILSGYPVAGGTALWLVHNYTNLIQGDRQMYVWGYYTLDGDEQERPNLVRPLQPSIELPAPIPYMPVNCGSDGVPVNVHEVGTEFQDEVTLDVKIVGYNSAAPSTEEMTAEGNGYLQPPAGAVYDPAITLLRFTNGTLPGGVVVPPVTMPIWSGSEEDDPLANASQTKRKFPWWKRWLDGIPMRGAGEIQILRSSYAALTQRSSARGTFVRY